MRNWAENQVTMVFIRHGETQANKERRYLGKTDESLSEKGIEMLGSYKRQNLYPDVEYLFTSPMKRCLETAEIIYPALCPVVIPEWEEIDFGRFEYKNYRELEADVQYQKWLDSNGALEFPEGESRKEFILRCKNGLLRMWNELDLMVEQNAAKPIKVGAVVHGGTIMSLMSLYGEKDYFDCQAGNGRGYMCRLTSMCDQEGERRNLQIKAVDEI